LEMLGGQRDADSTIREVPARFSSCFYLFPIEVDPSLQHKGIALKIRNMM